MSWQLLAEKIVALEHTNQISWKELAEAIGRSPGSLRSRSILSSSSRSSIMSRLFILPSADHP